MDGNFAKLAPRHRAGLRRSAMDFIRHKEAARGVKDDFSRAALKRSLVESRSPGLRESMTSATFLERTCRADVHALQETTDPNSQRLLRQMLERVHDPPVWDDAWSSPHSKWQWRQSVSRAKEEFERTSIVGRRLFQGVAFPPERSRDTVDEMESIIHSLAMGDDSRMLRQKETKTKISRMPPSLQKKQLSSSSSSSSVRYAYATRLDKFRLESDLLKRRRTPNTDDLNFVPNEAAK